MMYLCQEGRVLLHLNPWFKWDVEGLKARIRKLVSAYFVTITVGRYRGALRSVP